LAYSRACDGRLGGRHTRASPPGYDRALRVEGSVHDAFPAFPERPLALALPFATCHKPPKNRKHERLASL
jgi:hypothetical protein